MMQDRPTGEEERADMLWKTLANITEAAAILSNYDRDQKYGRTAGDWGRLKTRIAQSRMILEATREEE